MRVSWSGEVCMADWPHGHSPQRQTGPPRLAVSSSASASLRRYALAIGQLHMCPPLQHAGRTGHLIGLSAWYLEIPDLPAPAPQPHTHGEPLACGHIPASRAATMRAQIADRRLCRLICRMGRRRLARRALPAFRSGCFRAPRARSGLPRAHPKGSRLAASSEKYSPRSAEVPDSMGRREQKAGSPAR